MLPSSGISEYLGRSVEFFFNYFLFKAPKVQNLGAFSTFFLKKGEIPNPIFFNLILFFEMGSVAEGNTSIFFGGGGLIMRMQT